MPRKSREDLRIKVVTELCKCKPDYLSVIVEIKSFLNEYKTIDDVIDAACEVVGVTLSDLKSKSRDEEIVLGRYLCFYELIRRGFSKKRMADIFRKKRTSFQYGHDRVQMGVEVNEPYFVNAVNEFYDILYPPIEVDV